MPVWRLRHACLALLAVLCAGSGWERIEAPLATKFPRDLGAHYAQRTEWWYATGIAQETGSARRFGWQLTVFRQGLDPSEREPGEPLLAPRHLLAGHLAIVDMESKEIVHAERLRRIVPGLADASSEDLDVVLDGWSMRRVRAERDPTAPADERASEDVRIALSALDRDAGIGLDLVLVPKKPLVMHGARGVSVKGPEPGNASAYASWTRSQASGTITLRGKRVEVTGEAWFDHEWGSSQIGPGVVGWDWFGLRLDDGRELMAYRLRRADGGALPQSSGTLIGLDGKARHLTSADIRVVALTTWTSPHTQAVYPAQWHLEVRSEKIDLQITPQVRDCEIDARASTGTVYWEGPVSISGSSGGSGYAELVGYAGSMEGRF
jgi:predicted secreted hydrolase